ncbi:hypothetical protein G647_04351 [Cladophialophora carrionii CBS 160.54]|uniref:AB hydrolase-1 domain-containing protein n=1 Tax=Cladophialophora carrionii CBS 160.54 TaxID=1279043 RepID=V9DE87_9EURO|nr:uncharacterized protein G647_04351 [Cladophialophora carrionii CBS 160.54]ETI24981.1 hypothetical protein G647_04351 [Cladophialophora carrionii CBS 160.54]
MTSNPSYDATGVESYSIPDFHFSNGTTLHDLRVAYRSFNASSTAGAVLIPTCYSGLINTTLTFTTGPHAALAAYHVIVVAMLGNGESASPSTKPFFPEAGTLRYSDVVRAQHALLTQHLGVRGGLEAVVGFSMGGQQAYHWAVMYPGFVKRVVAICSSARTSLHNYAFLEGPVAALTSSIDYVAWKAMKAKVAAGEPVGVHLKEVLPKTGLRAFARAYAAWLTSPAWFRQRLFTTMEGSPASVEEWMRAREEGTLNWDAEDLLVLARMWQMGDIGAVTDASEAEPPVTPAQTQLGGKVPDDAAFQAALRGIQAKVLLMPCRTDQYFPPEDSEVEMKFLQRGTLAVIESVWGHVAGGGLNPADTAFMNERIAEFMKTE